MKRVYGFTLIELMITIAIIGVLSAVAFPAFVTYQERSHRTSNCKVPLLELAREMEVYKSIYKSYPTNSTEFDVIKIGKNPNAGNYTLTLDAGTVNTFTMRCALLDSSIDTDCGELMYDNFGRKGAQGKFTVANAIIQKCWR